MDYKKFIIGLIIPIAAYGAAVMLNGKVPDLTLLAVVGVSALCGLVLMVISGYEGRLILGVILTFGVLLLFTMVHNFDDESVQILSGGALLGLVLMLTTAPHFIDFEQIINLIRGGRKGTVRNMRIEGGVSTFWLDGATRDGSVIQVIGNIGEGSVGEGDIVWVRGKPDVRGIIRTSEVQNRSKSQAKNLQERKGSSEFSGVVVGGIYELKSKENMLGVKKVELMGFRVQRVDANGNPLETIEVEVKGDKYRSLVFDRDQVQVKGTWQQSGRLQLNEIRNLTSKTTTKFDLFS